MSAGLAALPEVRNMGASLDWPVDAVKGQHPWCSCEREKQKEKEKEKEKKKEKERGRERERQRERERETESDGIRGKAEGDCHSAGRHTALPGPWGYRPRRDKNRARTARLRTSTLRSDKS